MLKNKNIILIFILLFAFVAVNEFRQQKQTSYQKPAKTILKLNKTILSNYTSKLDENEDIDGFWGLPKKAKKAKKIQKDTNSTMQKPTIKKQKNKNILCIDKSCYKLLGIYHVKKRAFVALYNKTLKKSINSYAKNSVLELFVKITNISNDTVNFSEINSTNHWSFKLFDVNQTKYKPKEIKP
jgi:hypothetical protein